MVQLKVGTTETSVIGNEFYLGVRVGDSQKFSKVSSSYNFKFPTSASGSRRYGKIELFKRIGTCSISLDRALEDSIQEITLPGDIKFKIELSDGIEPVKSAAKDEKSASEAAKAKAAKDYLESHHLELRLAEAMRVVLKERPADPGAAFAQSLIASANMVMAKQIRQIQGTGEPEPQADGKAGLPTNTELDATKNRDQEMLSALLSDAKNVVQQVVQNAGLFNDAKEIVQRAVQTVSHASAADATATSASAGDATKLLRDAKELVQQVCQKATNSLDIAPVQRGATKQVQGTAEPEPQAASKAGLPANQELDATKLFRDAKEVVQKVVQNAGLLNDAKEIVQRAVQKAPQAFSAEATETVKVLMEKKGLPFLEGSSVPPASTGEPQALPTAADYAADCAERGLIQRSEEIVQQAVQKAFLLSDAKEIVQQVLQNAELLGIASGGKTAGVAQSQTAAEIVAAVLRTACAAVPI